MGQIYLDWLERTARALYQKKLNFNGLKTLILGASTPMR